MIDEHVLAMLVNERDSAKRLALRSLDALEREIRDMREELQAGVFTGSSSGDGARHLAVAYASEARFRSLTIALELLK